MSGELAVRGTGPGSGIEGLEDVGQEDLVLPMLRINHKEGRFIDSLSNEEWDTVEVVILGLVKQRILWPIEVGEAGEAPMCRAHEVRPDFAGAGFPRADTWDRTFIGLSKFDRDTIEAADPSLSGTLDNPLDCGTCGLKEWKTNTKTGGALCNEQYTMPVLLRLEDGHIAPYIFTTQKTGVKPVRAYVSSFVNAGKPMYSAWTRIGLQRLTKGSVEYAVPRYSKLDGTDPVDWSGYSTQLHVIREYLTTPRAPRDADETPVEVKPRGGSAVVADADPEPDDGAPATPPARSKPAAAKPAPAPAADYGDEEPF